MSKSEQYHELHIDEVGQRDKAPIPILLPLNRRLRMVGQRR